MPDSDDLLAVLATNRSHGSIGEHSLVDAVAHATRYIDAIPDTARRLIDLGSGGGLPGLVIAYLRPDLEITLVERRSNRADQLLRSVRALGLSEHVVVLAEDVRAVGVRSPGAFDVVTARSFASPSITAPCSVERA